MVNGIFVCMLLFFFNHEADSFPGRCRFRVGETGKAMEVRILACRCRHSSPQLLLSPRCLAPMDRGESGLEIFSKGMGLRPSTSLVT